MPRQTTRGRTVAAPSAEAVTLAAQARAFQRLHEFAVAAAGVLDPRALARLAVEHARALLDADAANLVWWDDDARQLELLATTNASPLDPPLIIAPGQGAAGQAYVQRAPVNLTDYPNWEHRLDDPRASTARVAAAVPLLVGDRARGALAVRSRRAAPFTGEDVQFLALLAAQVGPALESARLHGESEQRRQAEAELHLRDRALAAIANGVVILDALPANTPVRYANPAFERLTGYTTHDLREHGLAVLGGPETDATVLEQLCTEACAGASPTATPRLYRRDGSTFWGALSLSPVRDEAGRVTHIVVALVDATESREAERRLRALARAEKLRAVGQMASGAAHNLNQYLALVIGHADLALRRIETEPTAPSELRELVDSIARAALDGAEVVKRLQRFARPRTDGRAETVDMGELLRDVAKLTAPRWRDAAQASGQTIAVHVEIDGDALITGWPESLREALTNLMFNAVDALPTGGRIRLRAERRREQVIIEVTDSGVGMSGDVQAHVLELFFSTKGERGTGLGLPLVQQVVERHNGQLDIESAPGQGTTVRLTFPAASQAPRVARPVAGEPTTRPKRVLVVDDEPALGVLAARILRGAGHAVDTATSAEEALEYLAAAPYDVVISDIGMGAGMNGWVFAARARAAYPHVRFVFATGWGAEIDPEAARIHGIDAVVAKPYRISDLREALADSA